MIFEGINTVINVFSEPTKSADRRPERERVPQAPEVTNKLLTSLQTSLSHVSLTHIRPNESDQTLEPHLCAGVYNSDKQRDKTAVL